jgi:DNA-binding SARP family transcriptional activator
MTETRTPNGSVAAAVPGLDRQAFQRFPYGMLVVDRCGRIVSRNLQAERLIEATGLTGASITCCELLGCRTPDTVLADGCLTELANAHETSLPEVRVDVQTTNGSVQALWVMAAPLRDDRSHLILQLRPGVAHDRRRRADPHWTGGPKLRIRTLGGIVVECSGGPIEGSWLDQRTGQLLKYLIAERNRFAHADEIGESIWRNADFGVTNSVRYYIHALRRKIEPERGKREQSAFIVSRAGGYRLNLELVEVDADEFEVRVSAGLALAERDPQMAAGELERGLALYRGDFLADLPYADWAMPERHRLHDLACLGLHSLADIRLNLRMPASAIRSLERLATMVPYDESVHRQLMELDIACGHRSDAIRRYNALRARIRRTFGHDLDFTPADLTVPASTHAQ